MEKINPIIAQSVSPGDRRIWQAAQDLEASFLAEMLKSSGLGGTGNSDFTGGLGEEQFASFLREAQAKNMVQAGGIGLAEAFFHSMKGKLEK
ncbi:rod-binding protein [Primorskyibacter sp. S187A]|uniref:rod-binding protein n=1 Tax=Primorskyibacter sp. S187A TaxID=3415130 RepID=UPI003C7AAD2F